MTEKVIVDNVHVLRPRKSEAVTYGERRDNFMRNIWRDRSLSSSERLVGVIIATYLNRRSFQAWPSVGTLMSETGLSRRKIQYATERLVARGHYVLVQCGHGRSSNRYAPIENPARAQLVRGARQCTSEVHASAPYPLRGPSDQEGGRRKKDSDSRLPLRRGLDQEEGSTNGARPKNRGGQNRLSGKVAIKRNGRQKC